MDHFPFPVHPSSFLLILHLERGACLNKRPISIESKTYSLVFIGARGMEDSLPPLDSETTVALRVLCNVLPMFWKDTRFLNDNTYNQDMALVEKATDLWALHDEFHRVLPGGNTNALIAKRVLFLYAPEFAQRIETMASPRAIFYKLVLAAMRLDLGNNPVTDMTPIYRTLWQIAPELIDAICGDFHCHYWWRYPGGFANHSATLGSELARIFRQFRKGDLQVQIRERHHETNSWLCDVVALGIRDSFDGKFLLHVRFIAKDEGSDDPEDPGRLCLMDMTLHHVYTGSGTIFAFESTQSYNGDWEIRFALESDLRIFGKLQIPKQLLSIPNDKPCSYDTEAYGIRPMDGVPSLQTLVTQAIFTNGLWDRMRLTDQRRFCNEYGLLMLDSLSPKRRREELNVDDRELVEREDAEEARNHPELYALPNAERIAQRRGRKGLRGLSTLNVAHTF
jgi:hypothetical protein